MLKFHHQELTLLLGGPLVSAEVSSSGVDTASGDESLVGAKVLASGADKDSRGEPPVGDEVSASSVDSEIST